MTTLLHTECTPPYLELLPGSLLDSEQAALDVLSEFYDTGTNRLLIHQDSLPPEFFDLHTGLAGAILQKFQTYRIVAACVLTAERVGQGRFYEMVIEANRGRQFHVSYDRESAERWLLSI